MGSDTDTDTDTDTAPGQPAAHVPLVADEPALTRDGRPARAPAVPGQVSPLRALAGAAVAVAGVALGIGALLTVTDAPDGSPAVAAAPAQGSAQGPVEAAEPVEGTAVAPTPVDLPAGAAAAAPSAAPSAVTVRPAAPAPVAAAVAPRRTPASARAVAARPPVTVLNNTTRTGLADRAAARFTRAGWPVRLTGNFRGQLRATTVYYEPGQQAAARRFAATFRGVTRVLPRAANIPGPRGLVVVLTRAFPA